MAAGRQKKYKTAKKLESAIDKYFNSISHTATAIDTDGEKILNDAGEKITYTHFVIPPSVTGLCRFLGIDIRTWNNYSDAELHPEFQWATASAKARIEAWLEEQLLTRQKSLQGIIFNLQNNYGWRERREVGLDSETRKTVGGRISLEEKLALIDSLRKDGMCSETEGGNDGDGEENKS